MKQITKNILTSLGFISLLGVVAPGIAQTVTPEPIDFGAKQALTIKTAKKTHELSVEIADTPEEQARGLMYRKAVAPDSGMLFEFPEDRIASFWMKNTAVPLDLLFVRKDGRILKIIHSAKPYSLRSLTSEAPVRAVLEVAGGQADALEIRPGDVVIHPFFHNTP